MTKNWSALQRATFDHVATNPNHLEVFARAGAGKTTTLVEMTRRVPKGKRILVCAFNTKIREELQAKVDARVTVRTFHQLGYFAVMKLWGKVGINRYRQRDIVKSVLPGKDKVGPRVHSEIAKAVSMCMARLAGTEEEILDVMDTYDCGPADITERPMYVGWIREVLRRSREQDTEISFDDQVYLPAIFNVAGAQYDYVFVDEAQDCNPAQLRIVMNSLKRGGKIVAVGDDRQAIYAFRGAGENTMEELRETLQADVLPLSITYRCPVSVVKLAQNIVPDLQWAPGAQMGVIDFKSEKEFLSEVRPGDLVISRANAPLMVYSMELLVQGKRCVILGRDISAGLIALLDQVGREDIVELLTALDDYVIAETPKLIAAKKEDKAEELSDRVAALRALSEGLSNTAALRARIDNLFGEEENAPANAIIFSTVHKAKGLEFKRVWMFESTFRTHTVEGQNLYYVAITRAMETLHLVQLPTKNGKPPHSSAMYWMQQQEDQ